MLLFVQHLALRPRKPELVDQILAAVPERRRKPGRGAGDGYGAGLVHGVNLCLRSASIIAFIFPPLVSRSHIAFFTVCKVVEVQGLANVRVDRPWLVWAGSLAHDQVTISMGLMMVPGDDFGGICKAG